MSEEEQTEKEQQKQEEQDASKKALKTGAKAAATAYAGPIGGKAVDLASKTKLGDAALNTGAKIANQNPAFGKLANAANKTGVLDAADKAVDASNGGVGTTPNANATTGTTPSPTIPVSSNGLEENTEQKKSSSGFNLFGDQKSGGGLFSAFGRTEKQPSSEERSVSSKMFEFFKKHKVKFLAIIGGIVLFFVVLFLLLLVILGFAQGITNFFNGIIDFFTTDQQEEEEEYYNTLKEVQTEINRKYGVCIDVNLITAALTINTPVDDLLEEGQEIVNDSEDNSSYDSDLDNGEEPEIEVSYSRMKKQVKLLAYMQIVNKKYSLDKNYKSDTGYYCSSNTLEVLVDSTNQSSFDTSFFDWLNGATSLDSSTPEKIANNDKGGFGAFLTKKSNEEKNYAYYIYYPPFNSDGTCTNSYAKEMLPADKAELSIGDLGTKEDNVFYWNLINSFIPEYYAEYLPNSEPEKTEAIKKIADDIYLLYKDIGPSHTCAVSYAGPSSLCPNGISVEGVGTIELEDYVAGVVSNEAYASEGIEALKAQAVAARTYALYSTNYCQNSIANSTNAQTFTRDVNDKAREATIATQGEILVDRDGKIFSSQYDSFCYDDNDCPDATRNSNGTYTVTYTKVPYGEQHTITLTDSSQYGRILPGQGHARGMSQLVSYQLAKEGKSYQEILSYFYSDGVEISLVLSPTTTEGAEIIQGPITNYIASVSEFNQTIYSQVSKSGVGTRAGVVAAATTLVSEFYNQTGYKLPYELLPSGKYSGYGIDPSWGTNTGNSSYPVNGLDCSGFVSWAIHNGGFAYDVRSAQGWGNAGTKRAWNKGTTDSNAQPGDLIYNAPTSNNGTTGHIRMIIGVTNDGYIVAEASSRKNGIRITNISFKSTGNYYLVDMSGYYASATKVTDYPM